MTIRELGGLRAYFVAPDGPLLGTSQDALDLIGATYGQEVDLIVVPATRLHPDFLVLRTGMAGEFLQKMTNYGLRFAVIGDISAAVSESKPLQDFVTESNRRGQTLFAADEAELLRLLGR